MTLEEFTDLVESRYLILLRTLTDHFECVGGVVVQDEYRGDPITPPGTIPAGLWDPHVRTIFVYATPAARYTGDTLLLHIDNVLRHEIGHALGMDHAQLEELHL